MISGLSGQDIQTYASIAKQGSPALLGFLGRAFGLGQAEQQALTQGKFPAWFWILLGVGAGTVAGVYAQKKWPHHVAKVVKLTR